MSVPPGFTRATFTPKIGQRQGTPVEVHFNPVSLQYQITNTMKEGEGAKKKQYVSQSTGKLTMDLVFDTTHNGEDVRMHTDKIAKFMEPEADTKVPPVVEFQWGTYRFNGMFESYKETIDFFAGTGVPLRASVNVTMARQDAVFSSDTAADDPEPVDVPLALGDDATSAASRAGDPGAGRDLAAANGLESMRLGLGVSLTVGASVSLGPPVAFASGGAGFGIGGGVGVGIGGGAGVGVGVQAGVGIGGSASAGVSATAGAFAGIRAPRATAGAALSVNRLRPVASVSSIGTGARASFELGGRASLEGSSSMTADVGASTNLRARIQFESEG
jgi:hypothetical protein